jgi:hypothetical protein
MLHGRRGPALHYVLRYVLHYAHEGMKGHAMASLA